MKTIPKDGVVAWFNVSHSGVLVAMSNRNCFEGTPNMCRIFSEARAKELLKKEEAYEVWKEQREEKTG